jgi:hypothetical protein
MELGPGINVKDDRAGTPFTWALGCGTGTVLSTIKLALVKEMLRLSFPIGLI